MSLLFLFTRISTWLYIELIATLILVILNLIIPCLMVFTSFRNITNFYFASVALSSSLLNCLYVYYIVQTLQYKVLSENNCRAIYYLQTSCIVVLAYTITAMHANFVLCLFPSSPRSHAIRTCLQSCGACLRRFFRRFCFCLVLCIWSLSFTATIPLLYSLDSNEKSPKPVYCPGTTQISYLEEWFDRNRLIQTVIFNLIPFLLSLLLSLIALLKIFSDFIHYVYLRCRESQCSPCRERYSAQQTSLPSSNSRAILTGPPSIMIDSITPTSENADLPTSTSLQPCRMWCSTAFLRFILVLSCCLLACIYPIAMRFYLIYFSVLVPLIFTAINYSFGSSNTIEEYPLTRSRSSASAPPPMQRPSIVISSIEMSSNLDRRHLFPTMPITPTPPIANNKPRLSSSEQIELKSPLMMNILHERDESNATSSTTTATLQQNTLSKPKYFSNHLYENTRQIFRR